MMRLSFFYRATLCVFASSIILVLTSPHVFAGTNTTKTRGELTTLTWSVSGATACQHTFSGTIYPATADGLSTYWTNSTGASGSWSGNVLAPAGTYTFVCTTATGQSDQATLTIRDCTAPATWNGSACVAPPTGDIRAGTSQSGSCTIPSGSNRCTVNLNYTTQNTTQASVWTEDGSGRPALGTSNSGFDWTWVTNVSSVLILRNGEQNTGTELDRITLIGTCANGTTWNTTSGTCVADPTAPAAPDLTSGNIDQNSATIGTQTSFTSTITNNGTAGTSDGFYVLLQRATNSSGANATDVWAAYTSSLNAGANRSVGNPWTPNIAPSTIYMRACADKSSASNGGAITESNENNNCGGDWTAVTLSCPTGQGWSTANSRCETISATGDIKANNLDTGATCSIPLNGSVCSSGTISYTTTPATAASVWTTTTATPQNPSSGTSGSFSPNWLAYGANTFVLHLGSTNSGAELDRVTITGQCASGTWNGSTCASTASATLTVPNCTIANGASTCTVNMSWTSSGLSSLSVRQNGTQFSASLNDTSETRTLQYGSGASNTFTAVSGGTTYDTKTGTASCAGTWNGTTCVARPDLTAGAISPTSVTRNTATVFSTTLSNLGNASTGSGFTNLLQWASDSSGSGALPIDTETTTSLGASGTRTLNFTSWTTPTSGGVYFARACADKNSATDTGQITESNEDNNCGSPWTQINVQGNPTSSTTPVTNLTSTSATLNGLVRANGINTTTSFGFRNTTGSCGTLPSITVTTPSGGNVGSGFEYVAISGNVSGLTPNTIYYYCARGNNSNGPGYGTVRSFTTLSEAQTISVNAVEPINITPATSINFSFTVTKTPAAWAHQCRLTYNGTALTSYQTNNTSITSTSNPSEGEYIYTIECRLSLNNAVIDTDDVAVRVCRTNYVWDPDASACILPADLSAGALTPTTVMQGIATTFELPVTNTGDGATEVPFSVLFQYAASDPTAYAPTSGGRVAGAFTNNPNAPTLLAQGGPGGSGNGGGGGGGGGGNQTPTIIDLGADLISTLEGGDSAVAALTHTFNTAGVIYMRACADKASASDTGVIPEANENDNCGDWDAVTVCASDDPECAPPEIVDPTLLNNYTPLGTITFSCINSSRWSIHRSEGPSDGVFPINNQPYTGEVTQNVTTAGNYRLFCSNGDANDTAILTYDPSPPPANITLIASPATAKRGTVTSLSWTIEDPDNCALTASAVYPAGVGSDTARDSAVAAVNAILSDSSTRTDSNDPYGQITLRNALRQTRNGDFAVGKKSLTLYYTTDFSLTCETTVKKIRVNVTNVNEG